MGDFPIDTTTFIEPGRNCWRSEQASRAAWLVDGAAYFRAFRDAVARAEHSVFILSWDINSKVHLVRPDDSPGPTPAALVPFLNDVLSRRPELHVHVLTWHYHPIYAFEREWFAGLRFARSPGGRLHFHLDDRHPTGGSQHQKVVVIDDQLAFAGGLDLTVSRWDTPEHRVGDARRVMPSGRSFRPFHDVQIMVEGPVAAALGELARERWRRATGNEPVASRPPEEPGGAAWPEAVPPDVEDVEIGISRTLPEFDGRASVREVERLHVDVIRRARRFMYIENQYLSSRVVAAALEDRLRQADGPEIILVLPFDTGGWLERHTMDSLRKEILQRLRRADVHRRLQVCYPVRLEGTDQGEREQVVRVHAKVVIADDTFLRVGSANLSNRSMGLDSECDLALEARGRDDVVAAIRGFRVRLLGEHLGLTKSRAEAAFARPDSLIRAIETHDGGSRQLRLLAAEYDSELDRQIARCHWLDPEHPVDPEHLIDGTVPVDRQMSARKRIIILTAVVGLVLLIAGAWRWGPLSEAVDGEAIAAGFESVRRHPLAPVLITGAIAGLATIGVPVNLLLVTAALTFGAWSGFLYSFLGAQVSALAAFAAGHAISPRTVRRLIGSRLHDLSQSMARRSFLAVILFRVVPVAPFVVVNLAAGAARLSWTHFAFGTLAGMAPGMLLVAMLTDRLAAAARTPSATSVLVFLLVLAFAVGAVLAVRRRLRTRGPDL